MIFAGCALLAPEKPERPVRRSRPKAPEVAKQADEDEVRPEKPRPRIQETSIEESTAVPSPAPTGTPALIAALPPSGASSSTTSSHDADSVLPLLSPSTPPNVAAALRLVEEGRGLLQRQSYDPARERFEHSLAVDPTSPYSYYFLAQVHYQRQNYDQASAFAGRAAGLARRADGIWQARIATLQGAIYEAVGRYPEARRAYEQAMRADPANTNARTGLARLNLK